MKLRHSLTLLLLIGLGSITTSCDFIDHVERRAEAINNYEDNGLRLAKENRDLRDQITILKNEIQELNNDKKYLEVQITKLKGSTDKVGRSVASVAPVKREFLPSTQQDFVQFDVYQWNPNQLIETARDEFKKRSFVKSAQFFQALTFYFPGHKAIDDKLLLEAGIAAFESGIYYDWAQLHLSKMIADHPNSEFKRKALLWRALTDLKLGHKEKFYETAEEFRKKRQNSKEWAILRPYYEKIKQEYSPSI